MSKAVLVYLPPVTLLTAQLSTSVIFLWAATLITRAPIPARNGAGRAALSGVLEPGLAYTTGTSGLMLTGASHASLVSAMEPLLVVLIAWLALGRRPLPVTLVSLAAAIPGMILVAATEDSTSLENASAGDGLVLLGTLFAALYVIRTSQLSTRIAPLPLAAIQQCVGLAFVGFLLTAVLGLGLEQPDFRAVPARIWLLTLASGIMQFALAFWLYLFGMRTLSVDKAALFLTLIPLFGVGGAALFLGETLSFSQMCGAGLILGAVAMVSRNPRFCGQSA